MELVIGTLFIINLFSFFISSIDKYLAIKKQRRIPEILLIIISICGGGFGLLLSMFIFHHKIKKPIFFITVIVTSVIWVVLIGLGYYYNISFISSKKYLADDFNIAIIKSSHDENSNGIDDYTDIVLGAKEEAKRRPTYRSVYYVGGYPPDDEGVCTDTVWRALKNAGYSLRNLVDKDIKDNPSFYPRVSGKPDKNIDFRRVKNLKVFFNRNSQVLTNDINKIDEWMPGDIVIFGKDDSHIAIISDYRNKLGIPFIIHNAGQNKREEDAIVYWDKTKGITGHYRFQR